MHQKLALNAGVEKMIRKTSRALLIVSAALAATCTASATSYAENNTSFSAKGGTISIPAEDRQVMKELAALAKKYPSVFASSPIFENMCEKGPAGCTYIASWSACCCPDGGDMTCEAWPPM